MKPTEPEFLFLGLILPSLFALTLVAEGVWKILRKESGWINLALGFGVILLTFWVYFFLMS